MRLEKGEECDTLQVALPTNAQIPPELIWPN